MLAAGGWATGLDLAALERAEAFMAEHVAAAPKLARTAP
jgi:hydroxymethylglutaryl-CoA lyase